MNYEKLLQPGKIGTMELKNRMVMPGMGTNLAAADGTVSDVIVNYYSRRANGGIGLIITEVCCPDPSGRVIPGEIEATYNYFMPGLSRVPHAIHSGGAKACLQLAHGGCFASEGVTGQRPLTPSGKVTMLLPDENPQYMTVEQIHKLQEAYGQAAKRAKICGFDAVELHGAHGYMPLQFLSAYTNQRTDEYGGSLENRARFALETVRKIKEYCGEDFPLIYRLSADEDVPDGITLEEACKFAKMAEEAGADAIHVSAGTWDSRLQNYFDVLAGKKDPEGCHLSNGVAISMWVPPNYTPRASLAHLAAGVKKAVNIPVLAVCSITPEKGEEILEAGDADFISFGRQTIADPDWPNKIREGRPEDIRRCLRCNECLGQVMDNCGISCAVNPEGGHEHEPYVRDYPTKEPKKVAVVGGGPAGIYAAMEASSRGHKVTLYEKNPELGGQLKYVSIPDFKLDYKDYSEYLINAAKKGNFEIKLNCEATVDMIKEGGYEAVIVATGAETFKPASIKGSEDETILDPLKVLEGSVEVGNKVAIAGAGLVGCEVAMQLAEQGKEVTMIDRLPSACPDLTIYTKWVLDSKLAELHIKGIYSANIEEMTGNKIVVSKQDGSKETIEADSVVCALGLKPRRALLEQLRKELPNVHIIPVGDVNKARKIMQATHEGWHAGRTV